MRKPLIFALVGGLATLLQYAVLIAGVEFGGWRSDVASGVGYALSAGSSYALNYRYTFASGAPHARAVARFLGLATSGLVVNTLLMWLLAVRAGVPYVPSQLLTTCLVFAWNYLLSARWVYR